ncbi:MAG: alpha-E domain-containing protein [Propionibacteriaceae bacterium]|nr:alpha-E domain-containing protein [Micropruina sp.]
MLSRIAESLYWIGRYLERAEDTARLLDVQLQLAVEDPVVDRSAAARLLLTVMGIEPDDAADESAMVETLCNDPASPSSIVSALQGMRESARRSRETVPTEMWESINATWNAVRAGELRGNRPASAFKWVRERCAIISATAESTMRHDQGWYFFVLGRSTERVDMTARLVSAAASSISPTAWTTALRACGGHHAFVLSSHDQDSNQEAAEFLLLDRLFPRSIMRTLDTAIRAHDLLDGADRRGFDDDAVRLLGRARAELEYRTRASILVDLPDRMAALQQTCADANEVISRRYFEGAVAAEWHAGGYEEEAS